MPSSIPSPLIRQYTHILCFQNPGHAHTSIQDTTSQEYNLIGFWKYMTIAYTFHISGFLVSCIPTFMPPKRRVVTCTACGNTLPRHAFSYTQLKKSSRPKYNQCTKPASTSSIADFVSRATRQDLRALRCSIVFFSAIWLLLRTWPARCRLQSLLQSSWKDLAGPFPPNLDFQRCRRQANQRSPHWQTAPV